MCTCTLLRMRSAYMFEPPHLGTLPSDLDQTWHVVSRHYKRPGTISIRTCTRFCTCNLSGTIRWILTIFGMVRLCAKSFEYRQHNGKFNQNYARAIFCSCAMVLWNYWMNFNQIWNGETVCDNYQLPDNNIHFWRRKNIRAPDYARQCAHALWISLTVEWIEPDLVWWDCVWKLSDAEQKIHFRKIYNARASISPGSVATILKKIWTKPQPGLSQKEWWRPKAAILFDLTLAVTYFKFCMHCWSNIVAFELAGWASLLRRRDASRGRRPRLETFTQRLLSSLSCVVVVVWCSTNWCQSLATLWVERPTTETPQTGVSKRSAILFLQNGGFNFCTCVFFKNSVFELGSPNLVPFENSPRDICQKSLVENFRLLEVKNGNFPILWKIPLKN